MAKRASVGSGAAAERRPAGVEVRGTIAWCVFLGLAFASGSSVFGATGSTERAASPEEFKSIEALLDSIPKEMARDLEKKAKQNVAAREINKRLLDVAMGKSAVLELQVESWRPWKDFVGAAYQLRPMGKEFRVSGVRYQTDMWVYVLAESGPDLEDLKRGSPFRVEGTIVRADVSVDDELVFHLTLKDARILPKAKRDAGPSSSPKTP